MVNSAVDFLLVSVESYPKGFESFDVSCNINVEMDEKDFPSSSDESDVDFVPKEEEENSDSKSDVSDCETSEDESSTKKTGKRKKRSKRSSKKAKTNKCEEGEEDKEAVEEKSKTEVDALWADFKKDVNSVETKKTAESSKPSSERENVSHNKSSEGQVQTNPSDNKQKKGGFSFPNKGRGGGLSNVLSQIGKKDKMSTLQKSQLDWNKFKQSEGIEEEIKMFNRGKDGYLEKQDFLQRTDLRQFEIEKDLRTSRRKF